MNFPKKRIAVIGIFLLTLLAGFPADAFISTGGITDYLGNPIILGQSTMANSLPLVLSSNQTGINSFLDKNVTGTVGALSASVAIATNGMAATVITVTGTWSATISFQGFDGTQWIPVNGLTQPAGGITQALVSNGTIKINSGGYTQIRAIATAYTSGSANIFMNAGAGPALIEVYNDSGDPLVVKGNGTAGSPDTNVMTFQGIAGGTPISTKTDLSPNSPATVSVGVTSGTLLAANASRKGLIVINTSANTVSIGFGAAAVLNSGITLYPHGSFSMDEFSFDTGALNAIASGASSSVAIQEFQ